MKKELTIAAITFLFAATPVLAHSVSNQNENAQNNQGNHHENSFDIQNFVTIQPKHIDNDGDKDDRITPTSALSISPTATPSSIPCDPNLNWKNHGAYVSCFAHHHNDGDNDQDDAAHSDIGKKHHPTETPTPTVSVSPTTSISISPTLSVSISPTPSSSPSPSVSVLPSPVSSAMDTVFGGEKPFKNLGSLISRFISFLVHLI